MLNVLTTIGKKNYIKKEKSHMEKMVAVESKQWVLSMGRDKRNGAEKE